MNESINFPLGTPQVQMAERLQNQLQHNSANTQHSISGELKKDHEVRQEIVNETEETEGNIVDQEGHLGTEHEERESEERSEQGGDKAESSPPASEDDIQGRFINVVV